MSNRLLAGLDRDECDLYTRVWETWGSNAQIDKLIEEMAELIQALIKARIDGTTVNQTVCEEMADVLICLEQMSLHLEGKRNINGIPAWQMVLKIRREKILRLSKQLAEYRCKEGGGGMVVETPA